MLQTCFIITKTDTDTTHFYEHLLARNFLNFMEHQTHSRYFCAHHYAVTIGDVIFFNAYIYDANAKSLFKKFFAETEILEPENSQSEIFQAEFRRFQVDEKTHFEINFKNIFLNILL